jgi:small GTP-binding protein
MSERLNYCLIGDVNVGKTCLMLKYTQGMFYDKYHSTVGVDFGTKLIRRGGRDIRLNIWDTAGQEKYNSISRAYYRMCDIVIFVFDVTNVESFENLQKWYEQVIEHNTKSLLGIIVGNKNDLYPHQVSHIAIDSFIKQTGFEYVQISVKNNDVSEIFDRSLDIYFNTKLQTNDNPIHILKERNSCCW